MTRDISGSFLIFFLKVSNNCFLSHLNSSVCLTYIQVILLFLLDLVRILQSIILPCILPKLIAMVQEFIILWLCQDHVLQFLQGKWGKIIVKKVLLVSCLFIKVMKIQRIHVYLYSLWPLWILLICIFRVPFWENDLPQGSHL